MDISEMTTEDLIDQRREVQQLLSGRGWGAVRQILQEQADALQNTILFTPLAALGGAFAQEFAKGRLSGMLAVQGIVEMQLESLDLEIQRRQGEENATD